MASGVIFLSEVIKKMAAPDKYGKAVPFSISWRTMNRYSKKGGKLMSSKNAVLVMKEKTGAPTIETLRFAPNLPKPARRNPNHWDNKTRNIRIEGRPNPIKIHINNIITFNGMQVVY